MKVNKIEDLIYERNEDGITILGVQEVQSTLCIPKQLEGKLVTTIGARAFSEYRSIKELSLPEHVTRIGSHAFYNCRSVERLILWNNIRTMEDGAFKNCRQIRMVELHVTGESLRTVSQLFDELQQDLTLYLRYEDGRKAALYFPRDLVEYSEYTSRLHQPVTYGMGHSYRQVITGGVLNLERYDALFLGAKNELDDSVVREIALLRLLEPYQLKEDMKVQYESYVKTQAKTIMYEAISTKSMERIEYVLSNEFLTKEQTQELYEYASAKEQIEVSSKLLHYNTTHFSERTMEFDL